MSLEAIEQHFENVDIEAMAPGGALHFTADDVQNSPAVVIPKICGIYHNVRPFLDWASRFFLIPKKVKAVIVAFILLMDVICPAD